jgi:F-type H+-transporting ATPase subunit delta
MRAATSHSPTVLSYARALLELANDEKHADRIGKEMAAVHEIVGENPTFAAFLADPGIGAAERTAVLDKIFRGRASPLLMNFLGVLNDKGRLRLLKQIAEAYAALLDEQTGKVEVDVTVAQKLGREQLAEVKEKVSQALGKDAIVHQYVDPEIIGGLVLRVEDRLIDASVKYQLEAMRERLLSARRRQ